MSGSRGSRRPRAGSATGLRATRDHGRGPRRRGAARRRLAVPVGADRQRRELALRGNARRSRRSPADSGRGRPGSPSPPVPGSGRRRRSPWSPSPSRSRRRASCRPATAPSAAGYHPLGTKPETRALARSSSTSTTATASSSAFATKSVRPSRREREGVRRRAVGKRFRRRRARAVGPEGDGDLPDHLSRQRGRPRPPGSGWPAPRRASFRPEKRARRTGGPRPGSWRGRSPPAASTSDTDAPPQFVTASVFPSGDEDRAVGVPPDRDRAPRPSGREVDPEDVVERGPRHPEGTAVVRRRRARTEARSSRRRPAS